MQHDAHDCCPADLKADTSRDKRILRLVLVLNFAMFVLEIWQGLMADSTALLADSMDFLSDAFSYGITLYVIDRHLHTRAKASLLKAALMLILAVFALAQGIEHISRGAVPAYAVMGWVSVLALAVNVISAVLLFGSRGRDSNMRSVWLCSRNDALNNIAVLLAAGCVYVTGTLWPDLLVALFIAGLESASAVRIIAQARKELRDDQ